MKWTEDDETLLIDFVRENPIIFDNKIGDGNRMESIRQLYTDFAKYAFDGKCDGNELRGRWQKLRTYYIQLSRAKPQMDFEGKIMKWKHYPNMSFLATYVAKEIAKGQGGSVKQEPPRNTNYEANEHSSVFGNDHEFILPEEDINSHMQHNLNHIENMNSMIPIIKLEEEEDDANNYCSVTINNIDDDSHNGISNGNGETNGDEINDDHQYSDGSNGNINEPEVVMVTDQGEEVPLPGLKRGRGRPPRRNLPEITFSSFKAASSSTPIMTRPRETEMSFQKIHHLEQKKPRGRPRLSGHDMAAMPKWKISNVQSLQNNQPATSSSHFSEHSNKRMCFPSPTKNMHPMHMQQTIPQTYMPNVSNMHPNMPTSTSNEVQISERESDHMSKILLSLLGRVENPFRRTECFIQMLQIAKSYLQD